MLQKNEEKNKQDINVGYLYNEEHKPVVGVLGDRITLQPHLLQTRVVYKALLSKKIDAKKHACSRRVWCTTS